MNKILLVTEGMDGSSKKTQSELLYNTLTEKGIAAVIASFPNYLDLSSTMVSRYLNHEYDASKHLVDEITFIKQMSSFYAVDRVSTFMSRNADGTSLLDLYNEGTIIICDRYTTSNILHQTANIQNQIEQLRYIRWIEDLEYTDFGLPRPTQVYYLDVSPEVALDNMNKRYEGEAKHDAHENIDHLTRVYNNNRNIVEYCSWMPIQCTDGGAMRTREDIADQIFKHVEKLL
jgi:dTMP kinase